LRCHDLGKQVSEHVDRRRGAYRSLDLPTHLSYEVTADINVLRSLVVDRIVSEVDGAFIGLLGRVGESDVLCLRRGEKEIATID
jgi:hypothetical protein